jgi:UPF0176 protein
VEIRPVKRGITVRSRAILGASIAGIALLAACTSNAAAPSDSPPAASDSPTSSAASSAEHPAGSPAVTSLVSSAVSSVASRPASTAGLSASRTVPTSQTTSQTTSRTTSRTIGTRSLPRSTVAVRSPTAPSRPRVTVTVTRTHADVTVTAGPPKSTAEPAAISGECPYLGASVVSMITGQHHGDTRLVDLVPQPMCLFFRSDGGWMGSVRVIRAANPQAAAAAVNQHVPIADSQPASSPPGWVGGSTTKGGMTQDADAKSVYGVAKGTIAVIAEENESPSIKARLMATCAIYQLKLESGQPPSVCVPQG